MAKDGNLKLWKNRLSVSKRQFDKEAKPKIEKYRRYYKGDQWPRGEDSPYKDKTVDNMVFSNIRTLMPAINLQNPKIFVSARKKPHRTKSGILDTLSASAVFELLINYYWQELEIKRQTDKCLMDALLGPWGIMWLGHMTKSEKVQDATELEVNELITEDSPFAIRISPMDFRVDPEAQDSHLEDAEWVARRWVKRLDDIKKNPRYKNTSGLKANTKAKTDFKDDSGLDIASPSKTDDMSKSDDFDRVEGWEIWDKKNNRLITLVESHDKLLQDEEWPLEFDGFPAEILYFNECPDSLFPLSDTEVYISAQDELNRLRSLQLAHIRNVSQRKYVGDQNKFDNISDEERKITDGPDGSIAWINGDPSSALVPLRDANISQDLYITNNALKNNIREVMGVSQMEQGVAQKFDTAEESQQIAQGISIRRSERIAILEKFISRIARKLGKIMQQTMEAGDIPLNTEQFQFARQYAPTKLEKIVGENEAQVIMPWLNYSQEDIRGDFNFSIDVGSTAPINKEVRKQDVMMLAQILAENPYIDDYEATKHILEAFDVKDTDRLLRDPEEVAQEQQVAAQAEQEEIMGERQMKSETDILKTQMKTQSAEKTTLMKILGGQQGNR